jgi:NTE family protein
MKIGLALSGGAARGIAHVGVLKYLEERGVKPCCIAGTSAGSLVGAFYCSGISVEGLIDIALSMSWKDLIKISIPRMGLIKSSLLLSEIEEHIGKITFDQLKIPLIVNAVDLLHGKEVIIEKGPVAEAVEASCAIPGIFTPVKWNKYILVDGGLLDNVPAAHMKNRDIDFIIAVNVSAQKPLQKEPGNIFEVLIQSYDIIRRYRDIPGYKNTDVLIEPDLGDISIWDTGKAKILINRGYEAARKALDEIDLAKRPGRIARWLKKRKDKTRWADE